MTFYLLIIKRKNKFSIQLLTKEEAFLSIKITFFFLKSFKKLNFCYLKFPEHKKYFNQNETESQHPVT